MVEDLKHAGTWHASSEMLKMSVITGDSRSAQCFRVNGETESGQTRSIAGVQFF